MTTRTPKKSKKSSSPNAAIEKLEKFAEKFKNENNSTTTSPTTKKRRKISLSIHEQKRIVRLLSSSAIEIGAESNRREKSLEICSILIENGLLTNAVSSPLINFLVSIQSMDGLELILKHLSDVTESDLVKILLYGIGPAENGSKRSVVDFDHLPLILRILGYPYSPALLTQALKSLSSDQVLALLQFLNCLFGQLLVTQNSNAESAPNFEQAVDFLNCLLDASSRYILTSSAFENEIKYSATLVDSLARVITILNQRKARADTNLDEMALRKREYTIQILVFND